jgi:predicted DNA-binding transcriptional regulator YafY
VEARAVQNTRFERVLRLLSYLQSGPRFNAEQLARHFSVSRRTVFRDIMFLREMGIPVIFDERSDAYRLSPHFRISRVLPASDDELVTLFLAAHLSWLQAIPELAAVIGEATAKLLCGVSEGIRMEVANLLNACEFAPEAVTDSQILKSIFMAIRTRHQVRIQVVTRPATPALETKVAPYRVVIGMRQWLLEGRSSLHRKVDTFDISAIKRVEITEDTYTVPHGFRHRPIVLDPRFVPEIPNSSRP